MGSCCLIEASNLPGYSSLLHEEDNLIFSLFLFYRNAIAVSQ